MAFTYDGDGNRIQQTNHTVAPALTITYTNDNQGLSQVLVSDDGAVKTAVIFGQDLISQDDGAETRYLLADGLGTVRTEMVGSGVDVVGTYEPYGRLIQQTGSSGTVYGFTGEAHDATTGLVYLRARYYNPNLKIFMSKDPFPGWAISPASQNGYSYVHNNPVNLTDPTGYCIGALGGLDTLLCAAIGGAFIGGVFGAVTGGLSYVLAHPEFSEQSSPRGKVLLYSERTFCNSCLGVIEQFDQKFARIKVVIAGQEKGKY